ncbi:HNH endonuclease [Enterobacter roggenkampii]|uniref:HNH endonuclease n=1 Tax=Enterobacter roggenkampii TaxID=1812935 RepID=UPI000F84120C|nr:HNH endonuclease [Enterobacter roggenkampii]RTP25184.1 HNH endonuclease [Enterobacter roggenkampii]
MIRNCYVYDQEEQEIITMKKNSDNFNGNTWSDDDLLSTRTNIKRFYILEQRYTCPYCMQTFRSSNNRIWDIEHIISRDDEKNFMFDPLNLCVACLDCNNRKSNKKVTYSRARQRLPTRSQDYFFIHPHFDLYEEHIEVIKAGAFYIAKTTKGEKTIEICGLNRFYEFAGYDEAISSDNRIMHLANILSNCSTEDERRLVRRQIAMLAIEQNLR